MNQIRMRCQLTLRHARASAIASILAISLGAPMTLADEPRALDEVKERGWDFKQTQVELHPVADGVWRATGTANAYIILTSAGAVVIDTGLPHHALQVKERLESAVKGPIQKLIFTHAHTDHIGGAKLWKQAYPDAEIIAHEDFSKVQHELTILSEYYSRRGAKILPELVALSKKARSSNPLFEPGGLVPDVVVDNDEPLVLQVGDTEIHVLALPAGEGRDGLAVWLPKQKLLFTGDMTGPHFPMFPNLYSIRGERYREFLDYIHAVDHVISLKPEIIAHGHFDVIRGADYIEMALTRMRDAVQYVHDEVVAGMNAGKSLEVLMQEIKLPEHLKLSEGYGKVAFSVRGLWETYTGWFQFQSTTELYPVPARSVYPDLVVAAGGPDTIQQIAQAKLDGGEPEKALHLVEVAETAGSPSASLRALKREVLQNLRARAIRQTNNFMEVSWLDARIAELAPETKD
ncbi:MAG: MBL fold metallo-hydrolase [Myxococcota bacterium]